MFWHLFFLSFLYSKVLNVIIATLDVSIVYYFPYQNGAGVYPFHWELYSQMGDPKHSGPPKPHSLHFENQFARAIMKYPGQSPLLKCRCLSYVRFLATSLILSPLMLTNHAVQLISKKNTYSPVSFKMRLYYLILFPYQAGRGKLWRNPPGRWGNPLYNRKNQSGIRRWTVGQF